MLASLQTFDITNLTIGGPFDDFSVIFEEI